MNTENLEKLSALMDNELPDEMALSMINQAITDKSLQQTWMRYHLISEVMKNNLGTYYDKAFTQRVTHSLQNELTILAPSKPRTDWRKPAVGLAIAASVMGFVILNINKQTETNLPELRAQNSFYMSGEKINPLPVATVRWSNNESLTSPRLNRYLVNHQRNNHSANMQGVNPYARIVGYEVNQ